MVLKNNNVKLIKYYTRSENKFDDGRYLIEIIEAYVLSDELIIDITSKSLDEVETMLINKYPLASRFIFSNLDCKCIRFTGSTKWYSNGCKIHPQK